jgi:hypothetical protein
MIGKFDDTGMVFSLFKQPLPSFNSGNVILAKGPQWPIDSVVASLINMEETYGWRSDLQAFRNDGVNDYVDFGAAIGSYIDQMTINLWLSQKYTTGTNNIFWKSISATQQIAVYTASSGRVYASVSNGANQVASFDNLVGLVAEDEMYQLTIVIDLSGATKVVVYVNGTALTAASNPITAVSLPAVSGAAGSVLGRSGSTSTVNGLLKQCTLFNTAKTHEEVASLYTLGPDLGGLVLKSDGSLRRPISARSFSFRSGFGY